MVLHGEEYFLWPEDFYQEVVKYMRDNVGVTHQVAESKLKGWFGEARKQRKQEQQVDRSLPELLTLTL